MPTGTETRFQDMDVYAERLVVGAAGSRNTITGTEIGYTDGLTAGTVVASKAIVTDSGIKISGLLNLTFGAGTATVAPINFTAGTNLTTAAVGAEEFDGKVFYLTALASSRQVVDTEQFICLASNYTAADVATAQKVFNSPTGGAVTLAASTAYFFEAQYIISNTGTTSHTWATLFALGGTLTSIGYVATARTGVTSAVTITAASSLYIAVATQVPVTAASTSATEFVIISLKGIMRTATAGTVTPQIQASAQPGLSGTPGVTVLAGSYFRCWPVGTDAVASVGNWA